MAKAKKKANRRPAKKSTKAKKSKAKKKSGWRLW